jgi:peptidoglycan/LPS O-acetylase OafA/YrhL
MIIAAELVVSVAIVRVRSGRSLSRTAWAAGAVVVAGIGAFLLVTSLGSAAVPGQGHGLLTTAAATGAALVVLARAAPASRTVSASRSTRSLTVTGISGM